MLGLGFSLPGAYRASYYARHGKVWTFVGFSTYCDWPFERWASRPTSRYYSASWPCASPRSW
ncbi:hypothetical protein G5V59_01755 [Nocardioides sp. W3-2-3]|uniref:hypothetical protein n=1 Tax=Nocardioides convexus TaxID=2712224 RepID=UPI00241897E2|nr:hypothetical protein [Nocardioides convexus]NGZ99549.1 hypothetical protein [Nocardioides convexus]